MMAWLQLWTTSLMTTVALSFFLVIAQDSGLPEVGAEKQGPADIVKKGPHEVLFRQKREWIWNSLYVEEHKIQNGPFKIGQLKSSKKLEVMKFSIEGEGANDIFTVDDKGDLFVTRSLDREHKNAYHLIAKLFDGNKQLVEDAGEFVVQVTDINDNIPEFQHAYNSSIVERCQTGTKIIEVKATDADDPTTANAELRYSLTRDGETSAFKIDSITGMISCNKGILDRETRSQYVLVVKAQDMMGLPTGSTATTSVTITIDDINDNLASFTRNTYNLQVPEDYKLNKEITTLVLEDRDEPQNKKPIFSIVGDGSGTFHVGLNKDSDGSLVLDQPLDFETKNSYTFTVHVREDLGLIPDNNHNAVTKATVHVKVLDVDEPPVFTASIYNFTVEEEAFKNNFGRVIARDPDMVNNKIRYSILEKDCPFGIHPQSGQLSTLRKLDRELEAKHMFQVRAQEEGQNGLASFVTVNINVGDINDNAPDLVADDIFVCENDITDTVIGILTATDKDEQRASFTFSLASESSNFTIRDYGNNSAAIMVRQGPFSMDDPKDYSVDVRIRDGGQPIQTSTTKLAIKLCRCDTNRITTHCKAGARKMGVSVHALIAILLCILTILVIVILFVMRKRYQKDSLAGMKNSGEIHEQLVTYDEEGGGEMDTNGYDVSILTSACNDGSMLRHPDRHPHPSLYAMVQKPPFQAQPSACKGDMAAMIEEKKDEADHDRDGIPYDTLHIYGYEGPESLAGSLSSLESSSTGSNLDYDFLNDWGPRFRTLAELYGVDGPEYYHQY